MSAREADIRRSSPITYTDLRWYAWSVSAAFGTYFCMYAFRKPFTAATFADVTLWGIGYKSVLVTAQVLGYTLSKFIGIKVVSEICPQKRAIGIVVLIAVAQAALLLFGLIPAPYNLVALFLNGLPLGLVFGLVLGFLEGRRATEALTAGLCASFILADGVVKSAGAFLLQLGVAEFWMPFVTGLLFVPPLALFVWMLSRIPQPTTADVAQRAERVPMNRTERWSFFARYVVGLTPILLMFLLVTVVRSIRADFAPEIWQGLGYTDQPGIYARSEFVVAIGVLLVNGCNVLVRDNRRAFLTGLGVSISGMALIVFGLLGLRAGVIGGFAFMALVGLGLYLPYVAVHTTIFERLIAMTRDRGNICFLMYVADALGYLGYVAIMLGRGAASQSANLLGFFEAVCWSMVMASTVSLVICWWYFAWRRADAAVATESLSPTPAEV